MITVTMTYMTFDVTITTNEILAANTLIATTYHIVLEIFLIKKNSKK